jgi:hypothetical protein
MSDKSSPDAAPPPFESALGSGEERLLAQLVVHALGDGWRTPEDFLSYFGPEEIISSLSENDDLRAAILVEAAGVHERLARKKSVASGSEDLEIALSEGICDAEAILEVYAPDERVRHLDNQKLWRFATDGAFWKKSPGDAGHADAVRRIVWILERAIEQELVSADGIVEGLTFDQIVKCLPEQVAREVVIHALTIAEQRAAALTADALLEAVPLPALIDYVPLNYVWEHVVLDRIAGPGQLVERTEAEPAPAASKPTASKPAASQAPARAASQAPARAVSHAPAPAVKAKARPKKAKSAPRAAPPPKPSAPPPLPVSENDVDLDFDNADVAISAPPPRPPASVPPGSAGGAALEEAAEALRAIDRLPPSYQTLSVPILRSIESMYADLATTNDDDEREEIIRDSFPNETHLRAAMLALIELLDSSINVNEPLIRDADVDALIKIVLFEERRRDEQGGAGASRQGGRR